MVVVGFPSKVSQSWQTCIRPSRGADRQGAKATNAWSDPVASICRTDRTGAAENSMMAVVFPQQPAPGMNAEALMLLREIRDELRAMRLADATKRKKPVLRSTDRESLAVLLPAVYESTRFKQPGAPCACDP